MTILLDNRIGSKHYHELMPGSELTHLDAGDAAFSSVDGRLIGCEIKKLNDAVQCLYTGRLADHQIPLMAQMYDVRYLLLEGIYRADPESGVLQTWREFDSSKPVKCGQWYDVTSGRKRLMYGAFEAWLQSLSVLGGITVRQTVGEHATAALLQALYNWYQRDDHASMKVMHMAEGDGASLKRPVMLQRMLALLPHISWERSGRLLWRVGGVQFQRKDGRRMRVEDWYLEREIAEKSAMDIMRACDGENDS